MWWRRVGHYARPEAALLSAVLSASILDVMLTALMPWPTKLLVDNAIGGAPLPSFGRWLQTLPGTEDPVLLAAWLAAGTVLLFLLQQLLVAMTMVVRTRAGMRMSFRLAGAAFDRLQRLSPAATERRATGDLVQRIMQDSNCVRDLVLNSALPAITIAVTFVMMGWVMWQVDAVLTLIALSVVLPIGIVNWLFGGRLRERALKAAEVEGALNARAEQTLTAVGLVQQSGREQDEFSRYRQLTDEATRASLQSTLAAVQLYMATGGLLAIASTAVFAFGGLRALDGHVTLGDLLVFMAYTPQLFGPIDTSTRLAAGFSQAAARARRVFEVLDLPIDIEDPEDPQVLPVRAAGRGRTVFFERVCFEYEAGTAVLSDVTFEATPGQTIALVGRTGAGKSTLVSLISRSYDPTSGRVLIDGVDLRDLRLRELREQVAVVSQDPLLLPISIADNIAYGRPEATRDEVVAAAQAANADEFIEPLPDGYDTVLAEGGVTLSGGQRQRLAIARAVLKDAPIVILDEPTSALDSETEQRVLEALSRLQAERTTFVIAHRLSTISRATLIAVLDGGRVVEAGTHEELLAAGSLYPHFVSLDAGHDSTAPAQVGTDRRL